MDVVCRVGVDEERACSGATELVNMVRGHQRKTTGSQNYRLSVLHIQARDTTDHHQLFIRRVIVPRDQAPRRQLTNDDGCPLAGIAAQHSARCARRHTWDGFELYLSDVSSLRMTGRLLPSRDWRQSRGQWGNKHQRVHQSSGAHICPPIRSMAAQTEVMSGVRCSARFWPSLMAALVINVVSSASRAFPPFLQLPDISLLLLPKPQTQFAQDRERLQCPSPALYEFCNRSRRPRRHAHRGGGANGEPVDVIDRAAHGMMSPAGTTMRERHDKPAGNSHHYRKRVDRRRNCAHKPLGAEQRRLAATEPLGRHRCLMREVPSGHLRTAMPASSPQCATTEIGARMVIHDGSEDSNLAWRNQNPPSHTDDASVRENEPAEFVINSVTLQYNVRTDAFPRPRQTFP